MLAFDALVPALATFLPQQRWYSGTETPSSVELIGTDVQREPWPALCSLVVRADGAYYQLVLGVRPVEEHPDFLRGHDGAVVGELDTERGRAWVYEATVDPELGLVLLDVVSGGQCSAQQTRPPGTEQSNSSLIYDDEFILKVFRRLQPGPNPEIEMTSGLNRVGFTHVAPPLATKRWNDFDLAILQPFLAGGTEGWAMALTSLRDLFGVFDTQPVPMVIDFDSGPPPPSPAEAGGDFSAEADRLGATTAEMHLALAEAFGRFPADVDVWAWTVAEQITAASLSDSDKQRAYAIVDSLREVQNPGSAVRVHGDYHLGQVMRTDAGWFVLDFEGEPERPLEDRRRPSSPLRDVAGMLRSIHYAAMVALADRDEVELANAWEARNRQSFLDGYLREVKRGALIPDDRAEVEAVIRAFELEKAVYEVAYEAAHRPHWKNIPEAAVQRLLGATES
ncbi:MAG: phosphotransferase [Actinomycetota bacterium]|nr:phosphotransferase [Actinomycetota bacterium]